MAFGFCEILVPVQGENQIRVVVSPLIFLCSRLHEWSRFVFLYLVYLMGFFICCRRIPGMEYDLSLPSSISRI